MHILLFFLPFLVLASTYLDPGFRDAFFFGEMGFFEISQFFILLFLGLIFLKNYRQVKKIRSIIFSCVFFIGAMEEISWGQSFFHFSTLPIFSKFNLQSETNLHNLIPQGFFNGVIFQLIYIFLILIPLIYYLKKESKRPGYLPSISVILHFLFSSSLQIYSYPPFKGLEKIEGFIFLILFLLCLWVLLKSNEEKKISLFIWLLCGLNSLIFLKFNHLIGLKVYEIREFFIDTAILQLVLEKRKSQLQSALYIFAQR
jgi:hypothetical protein